MGPPSCEVSAFPKIIAPIYLSEDMLTKYTSFAAWYIACAGPNLTWLISLL